MSQKLQQLAEIEGFDDPMELLQEAITDSVVPGICMEPGCDYTTGVEPDQGRGWCELCEKNSVKSCLVLAEII